MATNPIIISKDWLNGVQKDLVKNYDRLGLRASGEWAESLDSFVKDKKNSLSVGIDGKDYTYWIENGRNKNQDQNPQTLKAWVGWAGSTFLADWVRDKGLNINPYAVAWKIAREGWDVPNRFNAGGLVTDVVTRERIQELNRSIGLSLVTDFKSTIIKDFK